MLANSSEFNSVGAGGLGGIGGGGVIEGLLLGTLLNRGGLLGGEDRGGDNCAREAAILAAISNNKDVNIGEFRGLAQEIGATKMEIAATANSILVETLKASFANERQVAALSVKTDAQFASLSVEGERQTAIILAKINQNEEQNLRDRIAELTRRGDNREIEISITNSNAQSQNQLQSQIQGQNTFFAQVLSPLVDQLNKQNQGIVNLGTMVGNAQTATNANTKVNS